ncbi:metal-dependent hydrolase, beta-lactamase superfamily I [Opitutaceae bacterium TAV1]|nr:metal-dependent hydrolase, beta-lactamase superfamily I [Opitutaceae bacterium TAV1]
MKLQFLGTGAGEGTPAIFCRCRVCQHARAHGGKNIRSRTSLLIDEELKIDQPPDTWHHVVTYGLDLCKVKDLFFTHSHGDHLDPAAVEVRLPFFTHGCEGPFNVYANETVLRQIRILTSAFPEVVKRRLIRPFIPVHAETAVITPLPADHAPEETALLFWIERNGKTLFFGHDSGWFPDSTWAWLEGKKADAVILECTQGKKADRRNHLGADALLEVRQRLIDTNVIAGTTAVVATHFSHNGQLTHDELEARLAPHGISIAHDGMILEI